MSKEDQETRGLSIQAIHRLPYYLQYLRELARQGTETISAPAVAAHFRLSEIQVRKDFAAVSTNGGKPRSGFPVHGLIEDMEHVLGYGNPNEAVLVGVGSLGQALLCYSGFAEYGLEIIAAFDQDPARIGTEIQGKHILPADKITDICRRMNVPMGIITVPASQAQSVCDQLVEGGVRGIWNFAPVHLSAPENVLVQNENMAASLALLSKHLYRDEGEE
ncbi:redox-sensing transcriptional repressor Rex [Ruminococcus sp.]|uniref:redox-sensing transcriptional repressor Rex n=1 Tax=Ruminococcus sp. TaxID=41978 RepID=UPI003EFC9A8F